MAQSKKLTDGSYIDASGVYDVTQKDTIENLLEDLFTVKDCSSEIASYHSSITGINLLGLGKLRLLFLTCHPKGTLVTNDWINNFVVLNKAAANRVGIIFTPSNGENVSKGMSGILYPTSMTIHLGGQSYPSGSTNYFRATAIYFVA